MGNLWINLALLMEKPTGISNYGLNLVPQLRSLQPHLLTAQAQQFPGFDCYPTPAHLTPEFGSRGHVQRLLWTQTVLPKILQTDGGTASPLLFSPVPEMPLWRGCRTVVMVHDFIPLRFPRGRSPLTQYFRWVVPQVLSQAVHIICNSEQTAADVVQFGQVPAAKVTPIPLAYDASHFRPLNLPRRNYFLYLGRFDPYKNLATLLRAFARLQSSNCELWMAGSPDPRFTPGLRQQAKELGIADRLRWLEYVPYGELPRLLNEAIALVFPSLWEGFGLPVLEALGCGTPVIAGAVASLPEVGGDGVLWVEVEKGEAIAAGMERLLREPQLGEQLSRAGLRQARRFSWEKTGEATARVLEGFL